MKYRVEVTGTNEMVWSTNAMRYDTKDEAEQALRDLAGRWLGMDAGRVVTDDTPQGEAFDADDTRIVLNYKW